MRLGSVASSSRRFHQPLGLLALLCLVWALAACGPLPRAFMEDDGAINPLAVPSGAAVLVVYPLAPGSSGDDSLAARLLAEELQRVGQPATAGFGHRGARAIEGRAEVLERRNGNERVTLTWELREFDGSLVGRHAHELLLPEGLWDEGAEEAFRLAAQDAAPALAELAAPQEVEQAYLPGWPPGVSLVVVEIPEGPSDSAQQLSEAMRDALRVRSLPLRSRAGTGDIAILGRIEAEPLEGGQAALAITWRVERDGIELGEIEQANVLPDEALRESWAPFARDVAEAAVPGLETLLREAALEASAASEAEPSDTEPGRSR